MTKLANEITNNNQRHVDDPVEVCIKARCHQSNTTSYTMPSLQPLDIVLYPVFTPIKTTISPYTQKSQAQALVSSQALASAIAPGHPCLPRVFQGASHASGPIGDDWAAVAAEGQG